MQYFRHKLVAAACAAALLSTTSCGFFEVDPVEDPNNPSLGSLDLVSLDTLLAYIDGLVGKNAQKVPGLCKEE